MAEIKHNKLLPGRKSLQILICLSMLTIITGRTGLPAQDNMVPGVIIDHIPSTTKIYIGSPSICILPDGSYIASHDHFGPGSTEHERALTAIFKSDNKGRSWRRISEINGQFWSNLFVHRDTLYIMGTWKHHGNLIIRQSADNGHTWSGPENNRTGLLREGEYHTALILNSTLISKPARKKTLQTDFVFLSL